jgi:hypothetical protein
MSKPKEKRKEITADELREFLKDKRMKMDCGSKFCLHNLSNTIFIHSPKNGLNKGLTET